MLKSTAKLNGNVQVPKQIKAYGTLSLKESLNLSLRKIHLNTKKKWARFRRSLRLSALKNKPNKICQKWNLKVRRLLLRHRWRSLSRTKNNLNISWKWWLRTTNSRMMFLMSRLWLKRPRKCRFGLIRSLNSCYSSRMLPSARMYWTSSLIKFKTTTID